MSAFWGSMKSSHERHQSTPPSYDQFRNGWLKFARLLTFDEKGAFSCEKCGQDVEILIFDGTFLSCRKDLIQPPPAVDSPIQDVGVDFAIRTFLPITEGKCLFEFASSSPQSPFSLQRCTFLTSERFSSLKNFFSKIYHELQEEVILFHILSSMNLKHKINKGWNLL